MNRDGLRAGDEDRRRVADRLRGALTDGRLTLPEYDDRVRDVFTARTFGHLSRLVADLPAEPAPPAAVPPRRLPLALAVIWTVWAAVLAVNVTFWVLASVSSHRAIYPWPIWVAGPSGAALLVATIGSSLIRRRESTG
ncbi:DUF1707 SHOCT-like domain-containing protein [Rhizomonospora bruguierae]|uniref:DUF1707 SHOCT-like domain-containing protein n=1 Tax=Rhizomonospora bruguierae TaxID=1581705 RepID=UPI001BCD5122|nr:DUF1707 domain-containing protein [Micromonospora sp. NBRC 107566]